MKVSTISETIISLALNQLHTELHRVYEIWLEVGNGDMSVLEARLDKLRDDFMSSTSKYLSDASQTRFYEDALTSVLTVVCGKKCD